MALRTIAVFLGLTATVATVSFAGECERKLLRWGLYETHFMVHNDEDFGRVMKWIRHNGFTIAYTDLSTGTLGLFMTEDQYNRVKFIFGNSLYPVEYE